MSMAFDPKMFTPTSTVDAPTTGDPIQDQTVSSDPAELEAFLADLNNFEYPDEFRIPVALSIAPDGEGNGEEGEEGEGTGEDGGDEGSGTEASTTTTSTVQSTNEQGPTINVNGRDLPVAEVERLMAFDAFLKTRPDVAAAMAERLAPTQTPGQPFVPTSTTPTATVPTEAEYVEPTPPESLDLDDPTAKFLWDNHVKQTKEMFDLKQSLHRQTEQYNQQRLEQGTRQAQFDMEMALTQFRDQFPMLNEEQIQVARRTAASMNILDGLMQNNPPVEALRRSMEIACYSDPHLRQALTQAAPPPTSNQVSKKRKQRLSAISGSPGTPDRTESPVRVSSDKDMVQAFAQEIAQHYQR